MTRKKFLMMMEQAPSGKVPVVKLTKPYPDTGLPESWRKKGAEYFVFGEDAHDHVASMHIRRPEGISFSVGMSKRYFDFVEYAPNPQIRSFFSPG